MTTTSITPNRAKNVDIFSEMIPPKSRRSDDAPHTTGNEPFLRSRMNFNKYLALLSKGYAPNEARAKLNIRSDKKASIERRMMHAVQKYQSRKIEEIVFLSELRHNYLYKTALIEFEKSKIDSKGNVRAGNPIFLQIANDSIKEIRKLLGLDKATNGIVNNGNMALFNWDSLHNNQSNDPQSLPNVPQSISSSQELTKIDAVEERIRQLERLAAEKKLENERAIEEHGEPVNDHDDSLPIEEVKRTIVLKATKSVQPKVEHKICAVSHTLDDILG